jgi:hypothetical protein
MDEGERCIATWIFEQANLPQHLMARGRLQCARGCNDAAD